jgi:delta-aminolevulinic acid dehydratase/porphobilinogen synthase
MPSVLLIIDMQSYFHAANNDRVQKNCLREIKSAVKSKTPIVFVEYDNCGRSLPSLIRAAKGGIKYHLVKEDDDGSPEIYDFLKKHRWTKRLIKTVGVNADACVQDTVEGLTSVLPNTKIHVVADACHTDYWPHGYNSALSYMNKLPNVRVVANIRKKASAKKTTVKSPRKK